MGKKASGKRRCAFYTAESVVNWIKREIEPEAKLLGRHKKVEVKIADRAVVLLMLFMVKPAKMLRFLFQFAMAVVMPFCIMLMAKGMKRLKSRCNEYNGHKRKVK